eukprot:311159-Pelagomonas_calceolata.AAC.6
MLDAYNCSCWTPASAHGSWQSTSRSLWSSYQLSSLAEGRATCDALLLPGSVGEWHASCCAP